MNAPLTKQINNNNICGNKNNEPKITNLLNENLIKIKEFNNKSVELILTEKSEEALELLKKLESFLESNIFELNFIPDKKILIIILHNLACAFQKIHDFENCIIYLEAVIFHFDKEIEEKYNIKITTDNFFDNLNNISQNHKINKLGDLILELRFSAKFHLQMSAALSEINRHVDSINHAKLALLICEDNLIKTNLLFFQMKQNNFKDSVIELPVDETKKDNLIEKICQNSKIILDICNKIKNLHNKKNYNKTSVKKLLFSENEDNKNNNFDSYLNYRKSEINNFRKNIVLFNNIKKYFEIQNNNEGTNISDWINLINISNILYLSPLNYEDLDLESDPKYELLRDSILEKIIMLTIGLLCVSTELRILSKNKKDTKINGEYFHYHCINFAYLFLPTKCPIIRSYIELYYNSYGQNIDIIPEGETKDIKINLLQNINLDIKDPLFFIRNEHINYTINNKNEIDYESLTKSEFIKKKKKSQSRVCPNSNNNCVSISSSQNDLNKYSEIISNNKVFDLAKKTKIKDNKAPKFKLDFHNINQLANLFSKSIKNSHKSNSNPKRMSEKEKNQKTHSNINKSEINKWKKINLGKSKNQKESLNEYITKINKIGFINNGGQSERLIYSKPYMKGIKIFENKNQKSFKQKSNPSSKKKTQHSLTDRKLTTDRLKSARLHSRENGEFIHHYNSVDMKKHKKFIGKEKINKKYNSAHEKKENNKKITYNSNKAKNDKNSIRPLLDKIFNNLNFCGQSKDNFVNSGKFLLSLKTSTGPYFNKHNNSDMKSKRKRAKSKD